MQSQLIEEASRVIPVPQVLINVVSKRVRQLSKGARPMVESPVHTNYSDIALREIIEGKLKPAEPAGDAEE